MTVTADTIRREQTVPSVCIVEFYMGTFRGNIAGFPRVCGTEPEIYP